MGNESRELDFGFDPATGIITGYSGYTSGIYAITIPKTIGGIPVTAIGNNVSFYLPIRYPNTVEIILGEGVTFDNSTFTGSLGSEFVKYYINNGRKAGTYFVKYSGGNARTGLRYSKQYTPDNE